MPIVKIVSCIFFFLLFIPFSQNQTVYNINWKPNDLNMSEFGLKSWYKRHLKKLELESENRKIRKQVKCLGGGNLYIHQSNLRRISDLNFIVGSNCSLSKQAENKLEDCIKVSSIIITPYKIKSANF